MIKDDHRVISFIKVTLLHYILIVPEDKLSILRIQ